MAKQNLAELRLNFIAMRELTEWRRQKTPSRPEMKKPSGLVLKKEKS